MSSRLNLVKAGILEIYAFTKLVNPVDFPRYDEVYLEPHLDVVAKRSTLQIIDPPPSNQAYVWERYSYRAPGPGQRRIFYPPVINVGRDVEEWLRKEYPELKGTVEQLMLHHINPPRKEGGLYPCSCGQIGGHKDPAYTGPQCCVCGHPYY